MKFNIHGPKDKPKLKLHNCHRRRRRYATVRCVYLFESAIIGATIMTYLLLVHKSGPNGEVCSTCYYV